MTITTITLRVALAIGSTELFNRIEEFFLNAKACQCTDFVHLNYFYSYPEFGKKWSNGKYSEYHEVKTMCHHCGEFPERNYAGYGTINLLKTNADRAFCLCNQCARKYGHSRWEKYQTTKQSQQLQLF